MKIVIRFDSDIVEAEDVLNLLMFLQQSEAFIWSVQRDVEVVEE
jgi:hypothetical protein